MNWLVTKIGAKAARVVMIVGIVLLAAFIAFVFGRCSDRSGDIEEQIKQSNSSTEAYGDAVENAANRIGDRTATDRDIDNAVEQVKDKIGNAKDPAAVRDAVIDSLCRKPSHRDDPACAMQPIDPG